MKKIIFFFLISILVAVPVQAREANQERIELKATNSATFRARLSLIKDEKKQELTERINNRLANLNQKATTHFTNVLIRIKALLDKLSAKDETGQATEKIGLAEAAITQAEAAVQAQAAKDYTIQFTDESGLKAGASAAKEQLKTDLKAVRELVQAARQSVVDVLQMMEEII